MQIDIWSDVVCPWCYIGSTTLRATLAAEGVSADIRFRSFQLDPQGPQTPVPTSEYLQRKYGPGATEAMERVTQVAQQVGLEFHLDKAWSGPTLDAHRVLHLAAGQERQDAVAQRFFAAQFTEGRSLFEHASLTDLAVEAGLDRAEVQRVLEGDDYGDAVAADIDMAANIGITGVPFFVFNNRLAVSGAQPPEVFQQALQQAQ